MQCKEYPSHDFAPKRGLTEQEQMCQVAAAGTKIKKKRGQFTTNQIGTAREKKTNTKPVVQHVDVTCQVRSKIKLHRTPRLALRLKAGRESTHETSSRRDEECQQQQYAHVLYPSIVRFRSSNQERRHVHVRVLVRERSVVTEVVPSIPHLKHTQQ